MDSTKNKKVDEDAMVGAGEGAMPADVQGNSDSASTLNAGFMKASKGRIANGDVLGHCDHNKEGGYMKDGCFHIPSGSAKAKHREILAGKKKKNHKNDYIKDMKILTESNADAKRMLMNTWKVVKSQFKTMEDVTKWFEDKKFAIQNSIDHDLEDDKQKALAQKAYDMLDYITQPEHNVVGEASFGKILKVLACIYILALFIPGALTGIYVGLSHGSIFGAIAGGIAGGVVNVWNGVIGLLLHLPIIGNIIGMLV